MLKDLLRTVQEAYSGLAARDDVARVAQYHRIQASPGFRDAARYVRDTLGAAGLNAEILSVPACEEVHYWAQLGFQEWEGRAATLHLIAPEEARTKLCDFRECKISLIQRSAATPPIEAEVVLLEDGLEEDEYAGLDLTGKVVLTKGDIYRVRELAIERHGAIGILFDGMRDWEPVRPPMSLPEARQYTSFWWSGPCKQCFGFVLSPRQGAALRQLLKTQAQEGKPPVRVRAQVDSRLYDGEMEIVSACIPGETDEEVLVVAHLCHPEPSANDNASGTGAALEAARALHTLIRDGALARPQRTIRFLWLAEMTGTYAYLATHEERIPQMVAGVNLDMVGEDQEQTGSVWIVEYPPEALPSYTGDLLATIQEALADNVKNLAGNASYALFRYGTSSFSGGSDHYIFSDPSVGVPMPMLIQWPDRFYHTSEDTIEKVSPRMLANVGVATATYAYWIATAGAAQVHWLAQQMVTRAKVSLARRAQDMITAALAAEGTEALTVQQRLLARKARYWGDQTAEALGSLARLAPEAQAAITEAQTLAQETIQAEVQRVEQALAARASELGISLPEAAPEPQSGADAEQARQITPRKKFPGPCSLRGYLEQLPRERQEEIYHWLRAHRQADNSTTLALYWADGKRNLEEIAALVEMESGTSDVAFLVRYFELLRELGLVQYDRM